MKKNVLVFGLISGLIITSMMVYSVAMCYNSDNFEGSEVLGYTGMIVAFSFIFVGIKNYRDKYNNGVISFGKAFKVGLLITLVASTMYVGVWLIEYYLFVPDFIDRYCTHVINQGKAKGLSEAQIARNSMLDFTRSMYKNPFGVILLTYLEVIPIGLVVALICALILKRKRPNPQL